MSKLFFLSLISIATIFAKSPEQRFQQYKKDIIFDAKTNLLWENTFQKYVYDVKEAQLYCQSLTVSGEKGWKVPSLRQLTTLLQYKNDIPLIDPIFHEFPQRFVSKLPWYRVITKDRHITDEFEGNVPFTVDFETGKTNAIAGGIPVRCVKPKDGKEFPTYKFERNNTTGIVTDTINKVMYNDDLTDYPQNPRWANMATIEKHCSEMSAKGYDDWRLPTIYELQRIVDVNRYKPASNVVFKNMDDASYLSSTKRTYIDKTKKGEIIGSFIFTYYVNFEAGATKFRTKDNNFYHMCVRDIKE